VDYEGEVLEAFVAKRRDREAAQGFFRKVMKPCGASGAIVTANFGSYRAALGVSSRPESASDPVIRDPFAPVCFHRHLLAFQDLPCAPGVRRTAQSSSLQLTRLAVE